MENLGTTTDVKATENPLFIKTSESGAKINCVLITDENYAMPTAVAITSMLQNKRKSTTYDIVVFGRNLSKQTKKKILKLNRTVSHVRIIDTEKYARKWANETRFKNLPANDTALLKFNIPEILSDWDKVLYLDCDLIVQKDLSALYNTDIENYLGAMTLNMGVKLGRDFKCLENKYFNSGVMLFNLKEMRKQHIPDKLRAYRETGINKFMDQDTFNMVFTDKIKYLPFHYNCLYSVLKMHPFTEIKKFYNIKSSLSKDAYIKNASIIHYSSHEKPWKYNYDFGKTFLEYYYQSPYRKEELVLKEFIKWREDLYPYSEEHLFETDASKIPVDIKKQITIKRGTKIVPVVFSVNKDYASYLGIALHSLVKHCNSKLFYDIYILHSGLTNSTIDEYYKFSSQNIKISTIDISSIVNDIHYPINGHRSQEAYYYYHVPELFSGYKKVLYLDSDIIVFDDVAKIYEFDLGNNILGATRNPVIYQTIRDIQYKININPSLYFNTGVLLINTRQFLSEKIKEKCLQLIKNKINYVRPDQDILNICCAGKVAYIDQRWNYQWSYETAKEPYDKIVDDEIDIYNAARKNIGILHFNSSKKPISNSGNSLANLFWNEAEETVFYDELKEKSLFEEKVSKPIKETIKRINRKLDDSKEELLNKTNLLLKKIETFEKTQTEAKIKISVVIPVYNTAPYLSQCLSSLKNQTLKEIEIICIDDGSTDDSYKILKQFAQKDSRFIILKQMNLGAGATRNRGMEIARGEYLSFLDSDDFFNADMLKLMYDKAKKNHTDIVICRSDIYNHNKKSLESAKWALQKDKLPKREIFSPYDLSDRLFTFNNSWAWDKLYKSSFVKTNKLTFQNIKASNDVAFVCMAFLCASRISIVDKVLATHRKNVGTSISDRRGVNWGYFFEAYKLLRKEMTNKGFMKDFGLAFINKMLRDAIHLYLIAPKEEKAKLHSFLRNKVFCEFEMQKYSYKDFVSRNDYLTYLFIKRNCSLKHPIISKVNRVITWPFRMLRGFSISIRNNGWEYTKAITIEKLKKITRFNRKYLTVNYRDLEAPENPVIPIVFATDLNYLFPTAVSITSILENSKKTDFYEFYLLVPSQITEIVSEKLSVIKKNYCNCTFNIIDMKDEFAGIKFTHTHITMQAFYRLQIPNLLEKYDKCIYLDGDTVVDGDIANFFNIKHKRYYVIGVKAASYHYCETTMLWHKDRLHIPSASQYINSGVLLMNLSRMRKDNLVPRLVEVAENYLDQDVVNIVFYNKIGHLPLRYNFMTKYFIIEDGKVVPDEKASAVYSKKEIDDGITNPLIIHYADFVKPWQDPTIPLGGVWKKYHELCPVKK